MLIFSSLRVSIELQFERGKKLVNFGLFLQWPSASLSVSLGLATISVCQLASGMNGAWQSRQRMVSI